MLNGIMQIYKYNPDPIDFKNWNSEYYAVFEVIENFLNKHLQNVSIYHIGSTSIKNCGGKGIIDIAIAVNESDFIKTREIIDSLGFQKQTTRNPWPEERPMRTGSINYKNKNFNIHLHIIKESSSEIQELINFKETLEKNEGLVKKYTDLKKSILSEKVTDSVEYTEKKSKFFKQYF